jgi:hypothetical protein
LFSSRLQFGVLPGSVLIVSIGALLLGNSPNAAGENTRGFSSPAGISRVSVCQTGVVESVSCDGYPLVTGDAAPVKFFGMLDTASSSNRLVGAIAGRQFTVEDGHALATNAQDLPSVDDQTGPPADETPTGAKVPEPASMVLLGMGLITMSKMSRRKRQPRQSQPVPRLISTCQHGSSLV